MRRRRLRSVIVGFLLFVFVALVFAAWPGQSRFTISPETTHITEPLDKHGYVDYITALNQQISKGITAEKNANALIWQALGPRPEGGALPPEYFRWLGIEAPPDTGEYWVSWDDYLKKRERTDANFERDSDADRALDPPYHPFTAKENKELAAWLEQNRKPLALVIEATRRPEYYNPLVDNHYGSEG